MVRGSIIRADVAYVLVQALLQIGLYYRSGSMWATWFIHLLSDLQLVVLAHYSLLPHL